MKSGVIRPLVETDFAGLSVLGAALSAQTLSARFHGGVPVLPSGYLASARQRWHAGWDAVVAACDDGLGGWLLGVLLVITALPGVPVDDELFAALSVGLPIGLGIYLAWVQRGWSAHTKGIGFAAALAGALMGAWLGFHAAADLLSVFTTIAGATAGANLALLLLDIAWDRQRRDRTASAPAAEPLEAGTSVG